MNKPSFLDEQKDYPPYDWNETVYVDGEQVRYISCPLDLDYLVPPDSALLESNPSLVPPEEHIIRRAVAENIVFSLLKQRSHFLEYIITPGEMWRTYKKIRDTENYLTNCLTESPVQHAAVVRVLRNFKQERLNLLSKKVLVLTDLIVQEHIS